MVICLNSSKENFSMSAKTIVNRPIYLFIAMLAFIAAGAVAGDHSSSGFLTPAIEAKLEKVTLSDGRKVMRWSSPELNGKNYDAVMVDRVVYYPAPNPGPQVSSSVLEQVADFLTESMRKNLGTAVKVVDQAGPRVLRVQPAITSVVVEEEGLSAKDIVPVHLLFSAASAATGKMDENVTVMAEFRVTDSMTRDYRAAVKMDIKGEQLKGKDDQLTLKDLQKSLDERAAVGATELREALSR